MYIRAKKIRNKEYAYLVENEWTTSGPRQKVKQYLGKIHKPAKKTSKTLTIDSMKEFNEIILDTIKWELENHGFTHNNKTLTKEGIIIHLNESKILYKNKNTVIALNNGHLCEQTINELKNFKPTTNQEETSQKLATKIVQAGINLPTETFIQLFEKLQQDNKNKEN